jgi:hypothetical protein
MGFTGNIERPGSMISWVLPETGLIESPELICPLCKVYRAKDEELTELVFALRPKDAAAGQRRLSRPVESISSLHSSAT